MTNEQTIKLNTLGALVRSLSGFFITGENPNGISPKEMKVITCFLFILKQNNTDTITREIKIAVANELNQSFQVTVNYLTKLRTKGIVVNNKFHPYFYKTKIILEKTYE